MEPSVHLWCFNAHSELNIVRDLTTVNFLTKQSLAVFWTPMKCKMLPNVVCSAMVAIYSNYTTIAILKQNYKWIS